MNDTLLTQSTSWTVADIGKFRKSTWRLVTENAKAVTMVMLAMAYGNVSAVMDISDAERIMLPEYCRHQANVSVRHPNPPRSLAWENELGSVFPHVHHYCWAMVNLTRSYRSSVSPQEKRSMLKGVVDDIDYVLIRASTNVPILADINTTKGRALLLMNEPRLAEQAFAEARRIDPTNWRAYYLWALYLQQSGRTKEASALVEQGLEQVPDSKSLATLLQELQRTNSGIKKDRKPKAE